MKILALGFILIFLTACPKTMPLFSGKFFQGDSAKAGISRNNPNEPAEFIPSTDPEFDKFTCTQTKDLINYLSQIQKALQSCKRWE